VVSCWLVGGQVRDGKLVGVVREGKEVRVRRRCGCWCLQVVSMINRLDAAKLYGCVHDSKTFRVANIPSLLGIVKKVITQSLVASDWYCQPGQKVCRVLRGDGGLESACHGAGQTDGSPRHTPRMLRSNSETLVLSSPLSMIIIISSTPCDQRYIDASHTCLEIRL
jgi:hypothetical protein